VLQCVAVCCSVLQCVAVCCSVLQCVAVCCSVYTIVCSALAQVQYTITLCCPYALTRILKCQTSSICTVYNRIVWARRRMYRILSYSIQSHCITPMRRLEYRRTVYNRTVLPYVQFTTALYQRVSATWVEETHTYALQCSVVWCSVLQCIRIVWARQRHMIVQEV